MNIQAQIKSLAVEYHAYCVACDGSDWSGVICWGAMLIETQENCGVQMFEPGTIRGMIAVAKRAQALDAAA